MRGISKKFTIKTCEHLSDDEAKTADNRLIARFLQCVLRDKNKNPLFCGFFDMFFDVGICQVVGVKQKVKKEGVKHEE